MSAGGQEFDRPEELRSSGGQLFRTTGVWGSAVQQVRSFRGQLFGRTGVSEGVRSSRGQLCRGPGVPEVGCSPEQEFGSSGGD